jgi:pilus assembly protein CpaB
MKRSQVLLLAVALVAGGLAGYLVLRGGGSPPAPVAQPVAESAPQQAQTQVLVAARDIGAGERLNGEAVEWQDWPESAVRPDYITIAMTPDAPKAMSGTVARYEILAGEPVREAKLVQSGQGYLAAILTPGMRAVSISVTPESGSGGFITPSDHVEVVSTHSSSGGQISETVLANVKVLAIGKSLGGKDEGSEGDDGDSSNAKGFSRSTIATLELDPAQAETLLSAANRGSLSLVLRSVTDFAATADTSQRRNQVKIVRYGKQTSVMAGASNPSGAVGIDPAAYDPPSSPTEPATPDVELQ